MARALALKPTVTKRGALDMQVCVPCTWKDKQVVGFANHHNPSGTAHGWFVRKKGSKFLKDAKERVVCEKVGREAFVHIMLDS